jgi:hypothetical protein
MYRIEYVDGHWSDWSAWSMCPVSCGGGLQTHNRSCDNPSPLHGGLICAGDSSETRACNRRRCPIGTFRICHVFQYTCISIIQGRVIISFRIT